MVGWMEGPYLYPVEEVTSSSSSSSPLDPRRRRGGCRGGRRTLTHMRCEASNLECGAPAFSANANHFKPPFRWALAVGAQLSGSVYVILPSQISPVAAVGADRAAGDGFRQAIGAVHVTSMWAQYSRPHQSARVLL